MTNPRGRHSPALPTDYSDLLAQIKDQVRAARLSAARAVNVELIALYWRIGRIIQQRQNAEGWGTRVIDRLAEDLRAEFPGMRGLSQRNLIYMRSLATAWPEQITQQPAARLPWGHLILLLDRLPEPAARDWYADQAVQHGWSRATLTHHIAADRRGRLGAAPNNFPATLPPAHSGLAVEILADPYNLDFLALDPGHSERQLEDAIVARLSHFLTELGAGFAFVGRQYRLPVGDQDYFLDLLFFHLGLRRYIIFELKVGRAEPEHLGKLSFYVTVVDDLLRRPEHGDQATIGILLAADRDDIVVEYALRGIDNPPGSQHLHHRPGPPRRRPARPADRGRPRRSRPRGPQRPQQHPLSWARRQPAPATPVRCYTADQHGASPCTLCAPHRDRGAGGDGEL